MAVFTNNTHLVSNANRAMDLIKDSIDDNGILLGTTNPYTFHTPSAPDEYSPEGQAFVLLLHAAWREFRNFAPRFFIGTLA